MFKALSGEDSPVQRVQVQSLVRELRFHVTHDQKKKLLVLFQDTVQPKEGREIRGKRE